MTDIDTIREIQRLMDGSVAATQRDAAANARKISSLLGIAGGETRDEIRPIHAEEEKAEV